MSYWLPPTSNWPVAVNGTVATNGMEFGQSAGIAKPGLVSLISPQDTKSLPKTVFRADPYIGNSTEKSSIKLYRLHEGLNTERGTEISKETWFSALLNGEVITAKK